MVRVVPKFVPKCGIEGGIEIHIPIRYRKVCYYYYTHYYSYIITYFLILLYTYN